MTNDEERGLIVTPHSALKAYLELALEEAGLKVDTVATLHEGLAYLKEHTPRLIVLDELSENDLDAAGFVWRVKRIKRLKHTPTIQIVHRASERDRMTMEISGADHIVELPIKDRLFRELLENLLSISR